MILINFSNNYDCKDNKKDDDLRCIDTSARPRSRTWDRLPNHDKYFGELIVFTEVVF